MKKREIRIEFYFDVISWNEEVWEAEKDEIRKEAERLFRHLREKFAHVSQNHNEEATIAVDFGVVVEPDYF